jgi:hypothetical protein|tara:strand:+ start:55 stop:312 length:258 start_codon:yes stop_codon:yes gene_type:complete
MSQIKLTEEELKRIQNLNQDFTKAKLDIADNVLRILGLVDNISDLRKAFAVDEKALSEKYGENASIDIATGEVKQVVKEEAEQVK